MDERLLNRRPPALTGNVFLPLTSHELNSTNDTALYMSDYVQGCPILRGRLESLNSGV